MLAGIEFIVSAAALVLGVGLFVIGVKRRPAPAGQRPATDSTTAILRTNLYSLAIVALLLFGISFMIDAFM
ncbi:MAG TPA: hypothetical protein VIR38_00015 [Thalassobaculum sp.]